MIFDFHFLLMLHSLKHRFFFWGRSNLQLQDILHFEQFQELFHTWKNIRYVKAIWNSEENPVFIFYPKFLPMMVWSQVLLKHVACRLSWFFKDATFSINATVCAASMKNHKSEHDTIFSSMRQWLPLLETNLALSRCVWLLKDAFQGRFVHFFMRFACLLSCHA